MIKAGDKVKFKKYDETIYTAVNIEDEHVRVINSTGTQLMQVRKYFIDVVEQSIDYKQRADELENHVKNLEMDSYLSRERADIYKNKVSELEKRWSEMEERMEREQKEAFSKGCIDYDTFSYVLEVMQDLQENNNA